MLGGQSPPYSISSFQWGAEAEALASYKQRMCIMPPLGILLRFQPCGQVQM